MCSDRSSAGSSHPWNDRCRVHRQSRPRVGLRLRRGLRILRPMVAERVRSRARRGEPFCELTYMATLCNLSHAGALIRHDPDLENDEQPLRYVYLAPEVDAWISTTLATAPVDRSRQLTPFEQVEQRLYDFAIGRPMAYGTEYHPLDPLGQAVWELKTVDVRLIGWFARRATFIIVCGRLKGELRKAKLYAPCIEHVVRFRNGLDLDPPKAITGVSRNDVL